MKSKFPLRTGFLDFKKNAKKHPFPNFLVYTSSSASSRLGIIIPKKVNKLATTRNWLKRLTYDTLWPHIKEQNLDVVVVYKPMPLIKSLQAKDLIIKAINSLKFGN